MNDTLVQTRITKDTHKKLTKIAKASGCSVATLVRQMIIRETRKN